METEEQIFGNSTILRERNAKQQVQDIRQKTEQVKQPVLRIGRGTSRLVVHWGRKTKRFRCRKTTFQLTHASGKVAWMVDHIFSMMAKDVAFVA